MIKLFSLVVDLLQISFLSDGDVYLDFAQKLVEKPESKIISFHPKGFVFLTFQDMLLGKISQEEFVALGDTFGSLYEYQSNPVFAKEAFVYGLQNQNDEYKNVFVVLPIKDKLYIQKAIPNIDEILNKIESQIIYL